MISLTVLLPTLLVALALWFSVRTRRGVLFGISVPLDFAESAEAKRLVARYRFRILLLTIAAAVSCLPAVLRSLPWLTIVVVPCLTIGGFVLWQIARRKVKAHSIVAPVERKAGIDTNAGTGEAWFALMTLALLPLAGTWLYLRRHWDEIPARFPIHWDMNGIANGWSTRSAVALARPLIFGAAIIVFMIFIAAFMRFTPAVDRQRSANIMFPTLAAVSWSFSMVFCGIALMPLRHSVSTADMVGIVVIHMAVVLGIVVWVLWRLMQTQGTDTYSGTPDSMWRAGGLFYYNPSDAAVMVPKRLGWGWTLNFGRPAAWVYVGVSLLFAIGVIIAAFLMK